MLKDMCMPNDHHYNLKKCDIDSVNEKFPKPGVTHFRAASTRPMHPNGRTAKPHQAGSFLPQPPANVPTDGHLTSRIHPPPRAHNGARPGVRRGRRHAASKLPGSGTPPQPERHAGPGARAHAGRRAAHSGLAAAHLHTHLPQDCGII